MAGRKTIRLTALFVTLALLLLLLLGILLWEKLHSDFSSPSDWEMAGLLEHEGALYRLRDDVKTLLVIGVDKFSGAATGGSYNNDQCADFLLLLVMDHTAKRCSVLQISRDTVTDVTVLGIGGKKTGTVRQQIALSHTYGSGDDDSCRNTARAVSALLGGISVDAYVCLTMDAVGIINDSVGGVTVTVTEDLTAIDPSFREGERVHLFSDKALLYVRQRATLTDSSNEARMRRQEQYLSALYTAFLSYIEEHDGIPLDTTARLAPYMHTDYSSFEMERAMERLSTYGLGEFYRPEGSYAVGEYMEFYPSMDALKAKLLSLFYEKV